MTIKLPTWAKVFSLFRQHPAFWIHNISFLSTIEIAVVYSTDFIIIAYTHLSHCEKLSGSCLKNALTGSWKRQFAKFICFCLQLILCRNKLKQKYLYCALVMRDDKHFDLAKMCLFVEFSCFVKKRECEANVLTAHALFSLQFPPAKVGKGQSHKKVTRENAEPWAFAIIKEAFFCILDHGRCATLRHFIWC